MDKKMQKYWNKVYSKNKISELGWYEKNPHCLNLIEKCDLNHDNIILEIGVGASTLIDHLIEKNFQNIYAVDISDVAIDKLKERLGEKKASKVNWLTDDLTAPEKINHLTNISLWHDRAVLHFLTKENDRKLYFSLLKKVVKNKGFVMIAVFAKDGAKKCSGLKVINYDEMMLSDYLGENFQLIKSFNYTYIMPSGSPRSYLYTLFQRMN